MQQRTAVRKIESSTESPSLSSITHPPIMPERKTEKKSEEKATEFSNPKSKEMDELLACDSSKKLMQASKIKTYPEFKLPEPKYILTDYCLGKGSQTQVWEAIFNREKVTALKIHFLDMKDDEKKKLVGEKNVLAGRIMWHLGQECDYIVRAYHFYNLSVGMELMPEGSFYQLLHNRKKISLHTLLQILLDVVKGLRFLHHYGVAHLNLKSSAVLLRMIDNQLRAKIAKFDSAIELPLVLQDFPIQEYNPINNPAYWSLLSLIELQRKKGTDVCLDNEVLACDNYSFGCLVWEGMTRRTPFEGVENVLQAEKWISDQKREFSHSADYPKELVNLMYSCWSPIEKRPTAQYLVVEFSAFIQSNKDELLRGSLSGREEQPSFPQPINLKTLIPRNQLTHLTVLASAGHGNVYRGELKGQVVAVKKCLDCHANFFREVKAMSQPEIMNSPYFVKLIGVSPKEKEEPYSFTMEFMPKGTLLQLINKRQKFSKKMFYQIALEIAQALEILERNGMINFDLKSSNILLDKDWHVKLADFEHTFFNEQIPQQIMTTPSCMPPEAFMKEPLTNACVIYSFGWILWEMVTLKNSWAEFWESTGFTDITIANISEHPMTKAIIQGRRAEIPDDCPEKLKKLILACWDGNPTKRPNVKEVVKELSELAKSEEKQQTAHITTAPLPKEEKSKERLPSSSISRIRYTLLPPPVSIPASILQEEIQRVSPVV